MHQNYFEKLQTCIGLKVKKFKSKLIGIWMEERTLCVYARMLNCKVRNIPFIYLGILIGANPSKEGTWDPVISKSIFLIINSLFFSFSLHTKSFMCLGM